MWLVHGYTNWKDCIGMCFVEIQLIRQFLIENTPSVAVVAIDTPGILVTARYSFCKCADYSEYANAKSVLTQLVTFLLQLSVIFFSSYIVGTQEADWEGYIVGTQEADWEGYIV